MKGMFYLFSMICFLFLIWTTSSIIFVEQNNRTNPIVSKKTAAQFMIAIIASPFISVFLFILLFFCVSSSIFILSFILFLFAFIKELKKDAYRLMHYLLWQLPFVGLLFFMSYDVLLSANIATLHFENHVTPGEFLKVIPNEYFFNFFNFFTAFIFTLFLGKYIPKYKKIFFFVLIIIFFSYFPFFKSMPYHGMLYLLLIIPFGLTIIEFVSFFKKRPDKNISLKAYLRTHQESLLYFFMYVTVGTLINGIHFPTLEIPEVVLIWIIIIIVLTLFFTGLRLGFLEKIPFSFSNIEKNIVFFFREIVKIYLFILIIGFSAVDSIFFRLVGGMFYPFLFFLCIKDLQLNKNENSFISLKNFLRYVFPLLLFIIFLFLSNMNQEENKKFIKYVSQFKTTDKLF